MTQLEDIRQLILKNDLILLRLLPFISYSKSMIRRGGIIGAVKNLCFDYDNHERLLLSPEIDMLSRLLLPLAGPEEFDSDDMDKLPDDLQYLPPDKEREEDPDIRIMLLETLILVYNFIRNIQIAKNNVKLQTQPNKLCFFYQL